MFKYKITIERPIEEVYHAYLDVTLTPLWMSRVQEVSNISGVPGNVGSVTRIVFNHDGKYIEMKRTVTVKESAFSFGGILEGPDMKGKFRTEFIDLGERTTLQASGSLSGISMFNRIVMFFMQKRIKANALRDIAKFKEIVESRQTDS